VEVEADPPVATPVDPLEDDVVGKVMDADDDGVVAAAMGALREATWEGAERRRALCTPWLLGALRRVPRLPRHAPARVDAAAALVNLTLEPANKVRIMRVGAVPALVEVLRSGASVPEAREHAAGALFGLALNEDNRAAIGVLGAVPPLLDQLTSPAQYPPRACCDAGMALYHLTFAAVNQSKVARFPGAPKALLAVASGAAEGWSSWWPATWPPAPRAATRAWTRAPSRLSPPSSSPRLPTTTLAPAARRTWRSGACRRCTR